MKRAPEELANLFLRMMTKQAPSQEEVMRAQGPSPEEVVKSIMEVAGEVVVALGRLGIECEPPEWDAESESCSFQARKDFPQGQFVVDIQPDSDPVEDEHGTLCWYPDIAVVQVDEEDGHPISLLPASAPKYVSRIFAGLKEGLPFPGIPMRRGENGCFTVHVPPHGPDRDDAGQYAGQYPADHCPAGTQDRNGFYKLG